MATEAELKQALLAAHKKGDKKAANLFATKIKEMRLAAQTPAESIPVFDAQGSPVEPLQQETVREPRGWLETLADNVTGSNMQTEQTRTLKAIGSAPELNEFSTEAAKAAAVQTFGTDNAMYNRLQDMGAKLYRDEKGNVIASMPSGEYLVNPPGLDPADVAKTAGQVGAFILGSRLAPNTVVGQVGGGGATSLGLQGISEAAGGGEGFSATKTAIDATIGGVGKIASNLLGAGARYFDRQPTNRPIDQAAQFAKENDLILTTSDITPPTTFFGKNAQSVGEKVPLLGTSGLRETQQEGRKRLVTELSERYGNPSLNEVTKSLLANVGKIKQEAGTKMQEVIRNAGQAQMPLTNTVSTIDDLIAKMTKAGMVVDDGVINALNKFKSEITAAPNSLEMLRDNRTLFRELVKGDAPVLSKTADRTNQAVYAAMTKDMLQGVESTLGAQAARQLRVADAIYAKEIASIKNTRLKNVLEKGNETPEVVANLLFSKKPSEVALLYKSLDEVGRQHARAAVISETMKQFAIRETPEAFLTSVRKMGPQINILFKGAERDQIKGMINYLEHTKQAGNAAVLTNTGQQMLAPAAVYDILQTGGSGTATAASVGVAARIYESKPVAAIMLRLSRETPGTARFEQLSREATRILAAETQKQTDE